MCLQLRPIVAQLLTYWTAHPVAFCTRLTGLSAHNCVFLEFAGALQLYICITLAANLSFFSLACVFLG